MTGHNLGGGGWGGGLEVKRFVENFPFSGENTNIWHQLFYHSISVTNGIRKTGKDLGKGISPPNAPL